LAVGLIPAIGLTQNAAAQTPPSTAVQSQNQDSEGLRDIIVTAQRRAENAQKVPIAISTVTADTVKALGVINPESLGQLLPGVQLNRSGQGVITYIRGIGSGSAVSGNEPSVAMFIDDVYMPNGSGAVFDFNNIDSVSVLKGPQGTLFGRNATGGVIQIKTRDPSQETHFNLDAGYGNFDKISSALYASTGITENMAVNVAGYYNNQRDGWGRNVLTGADHFTSKSYGVRSKLKGEFGDTTLLITGVFDKRISDEGGLSVSVVPGTYGFRGYSPAALGAGFYDAVNDQPMLFRNQSYNVSAKLEHNFGNVTLRSITAYGDIKFHLISESDASPSDFQDAILDQGSKTFTQEFQLLSASDSPVQWILGTYYLHDVSRNHTHLFGPAFAVAGVQVPGDTFGTQKTDSISGFGQMTAEILPRLKATLGIRYTSDRRSFDGYVNRPTGVLLNGPFADKTTFKNLTGRASLDYQISDDIMIYAAYNKGFKSGVYNIGGLFFGSSTVPGPVAPESLDAFSAGFKSEFFDRHVRLNVEAYYYDYSNIQVSQLQGLAFLITNGGKATIKGVDADLTVTPVHNLTLTWSASYADGHYDDFRNGPMFFPQPPNTPIAIPASCGLTTYPVGAPGGAGATKACDLSGKKTVQTAPFTSTFTAAYSIPTSIGEFRLMGSYSYGGKYYFEPDNNPYTRSPVTNLVNGSVSWTSSNERFGLTFWANNLTKEKYYNSISENTTGGFRYTPAAPRTYGLTGKLRL
jgi:iron complex outermembrane receptor protein